MKTLVIFLSHFISSFFASLAMTGLILLLYRNEAQYDLILVVPFYYFPIYLLTSWILHYQLLMRADQSSFVIWIRKYKGMYFDIAILGCLAFFYLTRGTPLFSVFTIQVPFLLLTSGFYFLVYDDKPESQEPALDELRDKWSWQRTFKDLLLIVAISMVGLIVKIIIFYMAKGEQVMFGLFSLLIRNPFIIIFLVLLQFLYFEKTLYNVREFLIDNLIVIINSFLLAGLFIFHNDLFVIRNVLLALLCVQAFIRIRGNFISTKNLV